MVENNDPVDADENKRESAYQTRMQIWRMIQILGILALLISHSVRINRLEKDIHSLKIGKISIEAENSEPGLLTRIFSAETAQEKDAKIPRVGQIRWTRMDLGFGKFYDATNTIVEVDSGHVKFADGMIIGRYPFETCYGKPINCLNCGYDK